MGPKANFSSVSPTQIYLFYPNIIGYVRLLLSLGSFVVLGNYPGLFLTFYTLSFVLDAADGMVARLMDQCSHFGAIFDMLTDRASTAGLLLVLNHVLQPMPDWCTTLFALLVFLDVASHFCRMYVTLFFRKESHKDTSESIFSLLRLYYSNRKVMFLLCVGQEFSYILLYAYWMYSEVDWVRRVTFPLLTVLGSLNVLKQVVNVQQLMDGMYHLAVLDAKEREERGKKN
ncbi:putative CDP-diacylglycerol--inositol 3-phosphatidyltransferase [Trypanosoma cruzi]|uniref:CDP-diacylglycerol--inositol 3-phosphatidyltransferase n=2 Tax=Trypanosoma cruzi TaxID=5693 RepID=Q4DAQ3_TRYCC|nr:phosphatidyltransferase, putative [Trypanosoma cruzi]EAN89608.1 phosphatidyltransferase, putative [Trypanosoma cruzi]KAF5215308.1 CDP-diacylglycerol--inositol 3-phosphatidyltransferase [Trypanosoma cruzi]KAF5222474.1 CDP-diacylglycerol--inositol 3-phosphatidyltransferase [Trypanosoma cruzi]KAF8296768.1 CDP-diacylglycerol--inositol 3-phosphatidyltransferase [Trypanosoma cruzi]PWV07810.1 putative CDP-diacylglycerol--inositol 3-phosphatidyltransferase [Trypanosoma cruzi]|eukprot:XP_811459.1 phosphatidyltransferase [Trypanosoma cruzi strain CL Brener]